MTKSKPQLFRKCLPLSFGNPDVDWIKCSDLKLTQRIFLFMFLGIFMGMSGCTTSNNVSKAPQLRATWMQARSITTPDKVDEMLVRLKKGDFNAVFVNVFAYGYAYFESEILQKQPDLAPEFDPLAYIIQQAHRQDIEVHAWLITGPVGGLKGPILSQHPEWAMVSLDGEKANWLNYNLPEVSQFIGDIALELVKEYEVDGIHFDYMRYPHPGGKWGFDPFSTSAFAKEYGYDPVSLSYRDLPAYGEFGGNALGGVDTAQVLAEFDNGQPAILLNYYGTGQVILFNWEADERQIAASSEILHRSINYLMEDAPGDVYLFRSETNIKEYGDEDFNRTLAWLKGIGWSPLEITEDKITLLDRDAVLIIPSVYLFKAEVASDLADFVEQGGGVIFIDGPTRSIKDKNIQAITGMRTEIGNFGWQSLLIAAKNHKIIPNSNRSTNLDEYSALDAQWKTFRAQGINKLLQNVYERIKQEAPHVMMTITISAKQETLNDKHFLDWSTWLEQKYVDLIIPRAYVQQNEPLAPVIAQWQAVINRSNQVMLGLSVYSDHTYKEDKTVDRMLSEIELTQGSGSNGIILFDIEGIGDDILDAIAYNSDF